MNNQFKKVSVTAQANTIPYSDSDGHITNWLANDPLINSIQGQNEFIGSVNTAPAPDTQEILTQFVVDTTGREPRNGDEVAIADVGELWIFNGTSWVFFTTTTLSDATTSSKGVVQIGSGINVSSGVISLDNNVITPNRVTTQDTSSTTASINVSENTDYIFTQPLTSLTLGTIANSTYYSDIYFTTGNSFTFTASNLTSYYFVNTPTFNANTEYKIHIVRGKAEISYIGKKGYLVSKYTYTNPALSPSSNIATWTITNDSGTKDVILRVYETSSGETVEMDSTITSSTIILSFYSESTVTAGFYTVVIIG